MQLLCLVSLKIDSRQECPKVSEAITIKATEFRDYFGVPLRNAYRDLPGLSKKIWIKFKPEKSDNGKEVPGYIEIPMFKSVYALRFYELFSRFKSTKMYVVKMEELRKILGLEEKYKSDSNFVRRVIEPAMSQIAKHTDFKKVDYKLIRKNKAVDHIKFRFEAEEAREDLKTLSKSEPAEITPKKVNKGKTFTKFDFFDEYLQKHAQFQEPLSKTRDRVWEWHKNQTDKEFWTDMYDFAKEYNSEQRDFSKRIKFSEKQLREKLGKNLWQIWHT
jgi:hypothetical protein